jgi:hypothetical protein
MGWLTVGSKKLGLEFAYIAVSTVFIFLTQHYVILEYHQPGSWDAIAFYLIFCYNLVTYLSLAFSDPGRLEPATGYGKKLDNFVRDL